MRANTNEDDGVVAGTIPDQQEVRFEMAFPVADVATAQFVHAIARFVDLLCNEALYSSIQEFDVSAALQCPLSVRLKLAGK